MTTEAQAWAETTELPDPLPTYPGGWQVYEAMQQLQVINWLRWQTGWDGTYEAVCPHGQVTTWNAFRITPLCTCPEMDT